MTDDAAKVEDIFLDPKIQKEDLAKEITWLFWDLIREDAEIQDIQKAGYSAAELILQARRKEVPELIEALRLTVEYVGTDLLPPLPGWSYYDALKKYAPEIARQFEAQHKRAHLVDITDSTFVRPKRMYLQGTIVDSKPYLLVSDDSVSWERQEFYKGPIGYHVDIVKPYYQLKFEDIPLQMNVKETTDE